MKRLQFFICIAILIAKIQAQDLKIVNTKDLIHIADKYGIDSALRLSGEFPIYLIDTLTATTLLNHVSDYRRYSRTEVFFNDMAQNFETKFLKEKTAKFLTQEIEKLELKRKDNYGNVIILDDKLIASVLKQKPDSSEKLLIKGYQFCQRTSDSLKAIYPSGFSWFFKSVISGTHPIVEDYIDWQLNCFRTMWALGKIKSSFFDSLKLNYHFSQLRKWEQERVLNRELQFYSNDASNLNKSFTQIINLKGSYESLSNLDFENEPELINIIGGFENRKNCWKVLLVNDKKGFLDLGCIYGPLAGHGSKYSLELLENDVLKITKIGEWIS